MDLLIAISEYYTTFNFVTAIGYNTFQLRSMLVFARGRPFPPVDRRPPQWQSRRSTAGPNAGPARAGSSTRGSISVRNGQRNSAHTPGGLAQIRQGRVSYAAAMPLHVTSLINTSTLGETLLFLDVDFFGNHSETLYELRSLIYGFQYDVFL